MYALLKDITQNYLMYVDTPQTAYQELFYEVNIIKGVCSGFFHTYSVLYFTLR